jgi:hypothetical protein
MFAMEIEDAGKAFPQWQCAGHMPLRHHGDRLAELGYTPFDRAIVS